MHGSKENGPRVLGELGLRPENLVGQVVSKKYEVVSVLGEGALGVVYKVVQTELNRVCALKILVADGPESEVARLEQFFFKAAKLEAKLSSDNIVSVLDVGVAEDGFVYLVMDYVNGESLEEMVFREGRIDPARAIPIFLCITNALQYAHEKGVFHKDLKPSHVMVARDNHGHDLVKLIDFGLAKYLAYDGVTQNLSHLGRLQGTSAYISPEQCLDREFDARSDIYSLGCIMYRVIVGGLPYSASNAFEALSMHVSAQPNPIANMAPGLVLPAVLESCIFKCLEKNSSARYANVMEVRADLEEALLALWSSYSAMETTDTLQIATSNPFDAMDPESLTSAANQGHSAAQFFLAMAQREGEIVEKDEPESMRWLIKSADAGYGQAQFELGTCYDFGDFMEQHTERAVHWYRKAAEQGVSSAMVNLACLLEGDRGIPSDLSEMIHWYRRAAESGHSLGQSNYARCLYYGIGTSVKLSEAVSWLIAALATDGDNEGALYLLANCYFFGDGVNKDPVLAVNLYRRAASIGHGGAACELGLCLVNGDGTARDVEEGLLWLERAVELGSELADEKLKDIRDVASIGAVDAEQLKSWLFTTSDLVVSQAADAELRVLLSLSPSKPLREIILLLKLMADQSHEHALVILARCYERGFGVSTDLMVAADCYRHAYDSGSNIAETCLIACLRRSFAAGIFPPDALGFLLLSTERDNIKAMVAVAEYFRSSNPEGRDFDQALGWYLRAAELGDREAQYLFGRALSMRNFNKNERERLLTWWCDETNKDFPSLDDFHEHAGEAERMLALTWLNRSAEAGSRDSLLFLSALRNRGLLLDKNSEDAAYMLRKSAELEEPRAQALLGVALIESNSGVHDPSLGLSWLGRAAELGDGFAQWNLALELIEGKNIAVNKPRAKVLLEESARIHFPQDTIWQEDGFQNRFVRLINLFEELTQRRQKEAVYWLGLCCERGIGMHKDLLRSALLFLQASEQGYEPGRVAFENVPDNIKYLARKRYLQLDFERR
ncbi:MAG: protein kinase [Candidatus Obscuribacterales bacterium]|nr:protein kinase [Candidatus Obscuribacterales bacterium]